MSPLTECVSSPRATPIRASTSSGPTVVACAASHRGPSPRTRSSPCGRRADAGLPSSSHRNISRRESGGHAGTVERHSRRSRAGTLRTWRSHPRGPRTAGGSRSADGSRAVPDCMWPTATPAERASLPPVTCLPAPPGLVAWSPAGNRLSYASVCSVGVVSVNATGPPPQPPPCPPETGTSLPSWSPDGRWLAYSNCRHLVCSVLVISAGTPTASPVYVARGRDPAWSPKGALIAYTHLTRDFKPARIHLVRRDGTHDRPLVGE